MKSHSDCLNKGSTLIEVIIYTMILSLLLGGFINYSYQVHMNNLKLNDEITDAYK